uniref:DNA polymerase n=1 Tax=Crypthecodinium cohnii TaxID=2866 RepID=A0A516AGX6_CRYCO|nr:DNA polymerase delta catalytic subunit [Crypthecodinium cohnii]USW07833.1 DNA polymerase delta catalytic subunit [Crypthecodinium cohnii]
MGKRGAPKGKAKAKAAGQEPAAKKRRGAASNAKPDPPPDPPEYWARPSLPEDVETKALRFFVVDVEDFGPAGTSTHDLLLYGLTLEGCSVCARLSGIRPYFYMRCASEIRGREEDLKQELSKQLGASTVLSVEVVRRTPLMTYQLEQDMFKVTLASQDKMKEAAHAVEGNRLPNFSGETFEAEVPFLLRFLVDKDFGGGRWVELPVGSWKKVEASSDTLISSSQLEVVADGDVLRAIPLKEEGGSAMPPVRTVAVEAQTDAEGHLAGASCTLSVQGVSSQHARAIWILQNDNEVVPDASTGGDQGWSEVQIEDYDPTKPEPPKVFTSTNEFSLAEHLAQTLALFDADFLLSYDLPLCVKGLLAGAPVAKSGSPLARALTRRVGLDVKLTPSSGEVSGLVGRLPFHLAKQVEKEHKLVDYSLGSLYEHFCKKPLAELRSSTLATLRSERPRAYASHLLKSAQACMQIFDKLALLFNFVEMARVTGVPLRYLLDRGEAVKVQAQLLRVAGSRGFVLPSQRSIVGEEARLEGATVLEPSKGFYRCPITVLDFASLYPSIMMAHNLCYSTMLRPGAEKKPDAPASKASPPIILGPESEGASTHFVQSSVRQGLLPFIVEQLLRERKATRRELAECGPGEDSRKKVLHGRQLALKISANSVYGFTGAVNGPLPCLELAGAVTAYGRQMIQTTRAKIESHFTTSAGYDNDAKVIYGDTDSVMVDWGDEQMSLEKATKLSEEAAKVCTDAFPSPVRLEFEKIYRPYLLMAKKRYAGLAWSSPKAEPSVEFKGIETVRRDWSDFTRQGMEKSLKLLLRPDGGDGQAEAVEFVRGLVRDLRENKVDLTSLVISKSLGREDYATKLPHVEVANKLRARLGPAASPSTGDRVCYVVLAGAPNTKVYDRAEDPLYALENEMPVDADYYLENQFKEPLTRVFEHVCGGTQKAKDVLFGMAAGQQQVVRSAASSASRGLGKFMKVKPKCLGCKTVTVATMEAPFCSGCESLATTKKEEIKEALSSRAKELHRQLDDLRKQCDEKCKTISEAYPNLPPDSTGGKAPEGEQCENVNCKALCGRRRLAKQLGTTTADLARLGVPTP